jgi:hypothetical protein
MYSTLQNGLKNSLIVLQFPDNQVRLMKSAIKLIAIQTILGLALILQEIPEAFKHDYFHGYSGPQPYSLHSQSPRLLNRQVKVAFFISYKSLLEEVLKGFKDLSLLPDSWISCFFISTCLAFLLENIEAGSKEFVYFSKLKHKVESFSMSDLKGYCLEVDSVVFDRVYRLLCSKVKTRNSGGSKMDMELLDALRGLRQNFGEYVS